jgi:hypothetical protein
MAKLSPMEKALKDLRRDGWRCGITEKWNPHVKIRQDLFGIVDLIAMKAGHPLLAVQTTTRNHVVERMTKSKETAAVWVSTGNRFEIFGYGPKGRRTVAMTGTGEWEDVTT